LHEEDWSPLPVLSHWRKGMKYAMGILLAKMLHLVHRRANFSRHSATSSQSKDNI
jgi:hypothetical protein